MTLHNDTKTNNDYHEYTNREYLIKSNYLLSAGCLLEGSRPPPDVPPRNPTMSRLNGRITGNPADLADFEPSCLVRTPSGNFYVPSGMFLFIEILNTRI